MTAEIVTRWNAAYVVDGDRIVRTERIGPDPSAVAAALARRREGRASVEEERLVAESVGGPLGTRDRRLVGDRVALVTRLKRPAHPDLPPRDRDAQRDLLLAAAERALVDAWDPSIHVEEAVRAMTDLDQVLNRVGERLGSWAQRDSMVGDEGDPGAIAHAARRIVGEGASPTPTELGPVDPELASARRRLSELYLAIDAARAEIEGAVERALPRRAPNLSRLLGPLLAARLLSLAGGIDRLSRLPASTIQVLGAERAFFEHLRGRAPPPRHGLLFLHPDIQGAPRRLRGKLARALAGKVAIAARLDREGAAVRPELLSAFEARRTAIRALGAKPAGRRAPGRSRAPLDRAALDR